MGDCPRQSAAVPPPTRDSRPSGRAQQHRLGNQRRWSIWPRLVGELDAAQRGWTYHGPMTSAGRRYHGRLTPALGASARRVRLYSQSMSTSSGRWIASRFPGELLRQVDVGDRSAGGAGAQPARSWDSGTRRRRRSGTRRRRPPPRRRRPAGHSGRSRRTTAGSRRRTRWRTRPPYRAAMVVARVLRYWARGNRSSPGMPSATSAGLVPSGGASSAAGAR